MLTQQTDSNQTPGPKLNTSSRASLRGSKTHIQVITFTNVGLQESDQYQTFRDFWNRYSSMREDHNNHDAVRAVYQNTIDYDSAPTFPTPLPDINLFENDPPVQIDLWIYSADDESKNSELVYGFSGSGGCNITLDDNEWLNIELVHDWVGTCETIIEVSDSIQSASDTFQVNVIPVVDIQNLPIAIRN